jgi:WD40 repeat protein
MARSVAILEPRAAVTLDDYLRDLAWAPDGRSLAVAGGEGKVYLVAVASDRLDARELSGHVPGTLAVAWAASGDRFATSGQDGSLALRDAATGAELKRWQPARAWTETLAWSPDGRMLASAAGRIVSLWTPAGERGPELAAHAGTVVALAWDAGGRDLGAASTGGIRVHRIEQASSGTPAIVSREYPAEGACLTVAWSPTGKVLATGLQAGSVHFWYLPSGRNSAMRGYSARVALTAWNASGRYLATSAAAEVVVWDFRGKGPEGSRPAQLVGHTERVESLAWQPGGTHLVSGGRDWRLSLWDPGRTNQALDAHLTEGEVTVVRWSPDGRYVAVGGARGNLAIYELVQAS